MCLFCISGQIIQIYFLVKNKYLIIFSVPIIPPVTGFVELLSNAQFLLHSVNFYLMNEYSSINFGFIKAKQLIRNSLVFNKSKTLIECKQIDKVVTVNAIVMA